MNSLTVSLVAEPIFHLGPITITNSMLYGTLATITLLIVMARVARNIRLRRFTRFSVAILWVYETLLDTTEEVIGSRAAARRLAPLAIAMFFVIIFNNWLGILPFVGTVTYHDEPVFRGLAADLNFTLALAIITMVTAQIYAIRSQGFGGNLSRYFSNPFKSFLKFFEGILELVAEFSRLIALSMRLFGNVFGGEVLLLVVGFITAWVAPLALPVFMGLELFVGAIQAYVFFMLTVVFVSLGQGHHAQDEASLTPPQTEPGMMGLTPVSGPTSHPTT